MKWVYSIAMIAAPACPPALSLPVAASDLTMCPGMPRAGSSWVTPEDDFVSGGFVHPLSTIVSSQAEKGVPAVTALTCNFQDRLHERKQSRLVRVCAFRNAFPGRWAMSDLTGVGLELAEEMSGWIGIGRPRNSNPARNRGNGTTLPSVSKSPSGSRICPVSWTSPITWRCWKAAWTWNPLEETCPWRMGVSACSRSIRMTARGR